MRYLNVTNNVSLKTKRIKIKGHLRGGCVSFFFLAKIRSSTIHSNTKGFFVIKMRRRGANSGINQEASRR